jgi:hypothetical protein
MKVFKKQMTRGQLMTWTNYIFRHLIPAWFYSFQRNFYMWSDLMAGNYEGYAIFPGDDPYTECYEWFWASISMNETYPKEFLDELHQKMVNMIDQNKMTRG